MGTAFDRYAIPGNLAAYRIRPTLCPRCQKAFGLSVGGRCLDCFVHEGEEHARTEALKWAATHLRKWIDMNHPFQHSAASSLERCASEIERGPNEHQLPPSQRGDGKSVPD